MRLLCFLISAAILAAAWTPSWVSAANLAQTLSRAHFEFSLDLYEQLIVGIDDSNLIYSPYSVQSVLSMVFLGTSSSSASSRQLRRALKYDNISYVDVHNAFKQIVKNFDDDYYSEMMSGAVGIFVQNGIAVSAPYDRALREFYHSRVTHVDFQSDETLGVVNKWANLGTEGQIPRLLDAAPDKDETKLLLANAMAMDAGWLFPFSQEDTFEKGLFFLRNGQR
jgi:serpin B